MGEFGFITADGTYHVTMYSTDEDGNYHVLSKKTLRRMEEKLIKILTSPKVQHSLHNMVGSALKYQGAGVAPPTPFTIHHNSEQEAVAPVPRVGGSGYQSNDDYHSNGGFGQQHPSEVAARTNAGHPQYYPSEEVARTNAANAGRPGNYPSEIASRTNAAHPQYPSEIASRTNAGHPQNYPSEIAARTNAGHPQYPSEIAQRTALSHPPSNDNYNQQQPPAVDNSASYADTHPTPFTIHQEPEIELRVPSFSVNNNNNGQDDDQYRKQEKKGRQLDLFGDNQSQLQPPVVQSSYPTQSQSPVYSELPAYQAQLEPLAFQPQLQQHPNQPLQTQLDSTGGLLYKFNYTLPYHGHSETGDLAGRKEGEYHVISENGWKRTVTYTADENGFKPHSKYTFNAAEPPRDENLHHVEFKWFNVPQ